MFYVLRQNRKRWGYALRQMHQMHFEITQVIVELKEAQAKEEETYE